MNVNDVYELMQYVVNKNRQGYLAPDDFNITINTGQNSYTQYLIGLLQQYQNGRPIPRVQFGLNQTVRQKITCLIDPPTTLTIDSGGVCDYPEDFLLVDAMYMVNPFMKPIRYAKQDKVYEYLNSSLDQVSLSPIYLIQNQQFQFYPQLIGSAVLSYIKQPPAILWAYTEDSDGLPVYDPTNSIDPVWQDTDMLDVIARSLKIVGINLDAAGVLRYANEVMAVGA